MKKLSLFGLALVFCLSLVSTAFAAELTEQPDYPILGSNFHALGKNDLYVIDINTAEEYFYILNNGTKVIETVISLSLTDQGRNVIFGNMEGPYKDEAQWIIERITLESRPDKTHYFVKHRYQILDKDKNVLLRNDKKSAPEKLQYGSDVTWWSKMITQFMQYQLEHGAYVDKTGKLCY